MARAFRMSEAIANAQADVATAYADGGYLRLFGDGSMLCELRLSDPAYEPASGGIAVARVIPLAIIARSGRADNFGVFRADSVTPCWEGSVGTSDADLILPTTRLEAGVQLQVTGLTFSAGPV